MALGRVFFNINGPVTLLVPDGRLVVPVHDNQLDLDVGVKGRSPAVAGPHSENELSPLVWWKEIRHRQLVLGRHDGFRHAAVKWAQKGHVAQKLSFSSDLSVLRSQPSHLTKRTVDKANIKRQRDKTGRWKEETRRFLSSSL